MDIAALVDAAVARAMAGEGAARECAPILVLGERDQALAEDLGRRLPSGAAIVFSGGKDRLPVAARYILPSLCPGGMADLALGRASGPVLTEALRLLLSGKKVEVLEFTYRRHAAEAPPALFRLYQGYEKTLASYGLVLFQERGPARQAGPAPGLISERLVREAAAAGEFILRAARAAIVTPLARDTARALNIHIQREE